MLSGIKWKKSPLVWKWCFNANSTGRRKGKNCIRDTLSQTYLWLYDGAINVLL